MDLRKEGTESKRKTAQRAHDREMELGLSALRKSLGGFK